MAMSSCHVEYDDGFGRPTWELEAEILRLTTRVMMMEREMKQMRHQMAQQTAQMQRAEDAWKSKLQQQENKLRTLLLRKDREMQDISLQLLIFESGLRKEQARIEQLLLEKDNVINRQHEELQRLRETLVTSEKSSGPEVPSLAQTRTKPRTNLPRENRQEGLISTGRDQSQPFPDHVTRSSATSNDAKFVEVSMDTPKRQNGPCHDVTNVWPRFGDTNGKTNDVFPVPVISGSGNQGSPSLSQQGRVKPKVLPKPKHLSVLTQRTAALQSPAFSDVNGARDAPHVTQQTNLNCLVNNGAADTAKTKALKRRYAKKQRSTAQIIDGVGVVESKGW